MEAADAPAGFPEAAAVQGDFLAEAAAPEGSPGAAEPDAPEAPVGAGVPAALAAPAAATAPARPVR